MAPVHASSACSVYQGTGGCCLGLQVLQTLYSCQPFRERLLQYAAGPATREAEETILSCLADLFLQVRATTTESNHYPG